MNLLLISTALLCSLLATPPAAVAEEVRLLDLEPTDAQQIIESQDQTLRYAPKVDSNVPAVRYLGNEPHQVLEDVYLANQYHGQDGLGGYLYGYSVPDIAKTEKKKAGGDLRGAYNYISGDGQEIKVEYWDDGNGFHQIDNVPKILPKQIEDTSEVKAAKQKFFARWHEEAERNQHPVQDPNIRVHVQGQSNYPHVAQTYAPKSQFSSQFPQLSGSQIRQSSGQSYQPIGATSQASGQYQPSPSGQPVGQPSQQGGSYQQPSSGGLFGQSQQSSGQNYPSGGQGQGGLGGQQGSHQQPSGSQGQYQGPSQGQYQLGGQQRPQGGQGQLGGGPSQGQGGHGQYGSVEGQYQGGQGGQGQNGPAAGSPGGQYQGGSGSQGQYGSAGGQYHGGPGSQGQYSSTGGQHQGGQGGQGQNGPTAGGSGGQGQYGSAGGQYQGGAGGQGQYGSAGGQHQGGSGDQGQYGSTGGQYQGGPGGQGQYGSSGGHQGGQGGQGQYGSAGGQHQGGVGGQAGQGGHGGQGSYSSQNQVDYTGQYSEHKGIYSSQGRSNQEEEEWTTGPPKGFFYSFDYPVGIIVSKGSAVKKEGNLQDIYQANKAQFEAQVQSGSGASNAYLIN